MKLKHVHRQFSVFETHDHFFQRNVERSKSKLRIMDGKTLTPLESVLARRFMPLANNTKKSVA